MTAAPGAVEIVRMGKRAIEVRRSVARTALNPTCGYLGLGFTHTFNPYGGCGFGRDGCGLYCYAQLVYPALARGGAAAWGDWVDVKINAPELLGRELDRAIAEGKPPAIYMSSVTDPFQPLEARFGVSRRALDVMLERPPRALVVQTRSPLVRGVLDALQELGRRGATVWLSLSIETDDDDLRLRWMPRTPSIASRLETARRARARGVAVQATVSPLLPADPERLARLLDPVVDRVVVDTLRLGDGRDGARRRALPVAERLRAAGREDLLGIAAHVEVVETLTRRLGKDRVLLSRAGFNAIA